MLTAKTFRFQALCIFFLLSAAVTFGAFPAAADWQGERPAPYDIPAQNLATALNAYAAVSGVQVLYEAALTADRRSMPVKGTFTPEAALQVLLAGSGLLARRTDIDAITLSSVPQERAATSSVPVVPDARFLGAMQSGILDVLCRRSETRPGAYRMTLQLWIAPNGTIQRAALLDSTGDARRDEMLAAELRNVSVGAAPPAGMAQPLTMTIVPHAALEGEECAGR